MRLSTLREICFKTPVDILSIDETKKKQKLTLSSEILKSMQMVTNFFPTAKTKIKMEKGKQFMSTMVPSKREWKILKEFMENLFAQNNIKEKVVP